MQALLRTCSRKLRRQSWASVFTRNLDEGPHATFGSLLAKAGDADEFFCGR